VILDRLGALEAEELRAAPWPQGDVEHDQRLEATGEPALRLARGPGDRAQAPPGLGVELDDQIGLADRGAGQDDGPRGQLGVAGGHQCPAPPRPAATRAAARSGWR
jgi:hypothetical protein